MIKFEKETKMYFSACIAIIFRIIKSSFDRCEIVDLLQIIIALYLEIMNRIEIHIGGKICV